MKIGAVFPQAHAKDPPDRLRRFVERVETMGYQHLLIFDHVAPSVARRTSHLPMTPYIYSDPFHEAIVLAGFIVGATRDLGAVLGVLVLPQRQTVLAAKQLATLNFISGDRVRAGLGVGWNPIEYEALGAPFHRRGDLLDEQIQIMQALWRDDLVSYHGEFHDFDEVGITPRPEPETPIWFGGQSDRMFRRIAESGAGWIPPRIDMTTARSPEMHQLLAGLDEELARVGRRRDDIGLEGRVGWRGERDALLAEVEDWQSLGVTHLSITVEEPTANLDEEADSLEAAMAAISSGEDWRNT